MPEIQMARQPGCGEFSQMDQKNDSDTPPDATPDAARRPGRSTCRDRPDSKLKPKNQAHPDDRAPFALNTFEGGETAMNLALPIHDSIRYARPLDL